MNRWCPRCKKEKDDSLFVRNGKEYKRCVQCQEKLEKYREDPSNEFKKKRAERYIVSKERNTARVRAYRRANPEKAREYRRSHAAAIAARRGKYTSRPKYRYRNMRDSAKHRGIECTLSFDEYAKISANECVYCNGFFPKVRTGSGIDRVDNSRGYVSGNCVSCCKTCNTIKGATLSAEETIAAVSAIISIRTKANGKERAHFQMSPFDPMRLRAPWEASSRYTSTPRAESQCRAGRKSILEEA